MHEELLNKYILDCIQAVKNYRGYMLDNQLLYEIQNKLNEIQFLYEKQSLIFKSIAAKIKFNNSIVTLCFVAEKDNIYTQYIQNYLESQYLLNNL